MAEAWQTIEEAALTLGISTRTLHRRISKEEFQTRLHGGRREVLVRLPEMPMSAGVTGSGVHGGQAGQGMSGSAGYGMGQVSTGAGEAGDADGYGNQQGDLSGGPDRVSANGRSTVQATVTGTADGDDEDAGTMLALTEDRLRRTDLAIFAYQQSVSTAMAEARRVRTSARVAWGAASVLATVLVVVSIWATHRLTASEAQVHRSEADINQLRTDMTSVADMADSRQKALEQAKKEAEEARIKAAQAEGELAVTRALADQSAKETATWRLLVAGATSQPTSQPSQPSQP